MVCNKHEPLKHVVYIMVLLTCLSPLKAQQTLMYTQYTFNKAGLNPAASGTDLNQEMYYVFGVGRPYYGLSGSPKQTFVNFSYTIREPRSISFWQNIGIYVEDEESGLFSQNNFYAGYTMHRLLRKKILFSWGIYAGFRRIGRSTGGFDSNDPAVSKTTDLLLYPDLLPGVRVASQKFFAGLSLKQVSITSLRDFKGRKIGSPSRLTPTLYAEYGQKIPLMANVLFMPSVAVNAPIIGPPLIDATALFYLYNRVGLGVGMRGTSLVNGILQIRFLKNLCAGFAYGYAVGNMRYAQSQTFEIMVGVTPVGMDVKVTGQHSIARCPDLQF